MKTHRPWGLRDFPWVCIAEEVDNRVRGGGQDKGSGDGGRRRNYGRDGGDKLFIQLLVQLRFGA